MKNLKTEFNSQIVFFALLRYLLSFAAVCGMTHAQINYSSDFESLNVNNSSVLSDNSWTAYANVFSSGGSYLYSYSSTPPIGGGGFWGVTTDQAGTAQGTQGLVVYSDYYNQNAQASGNLVEAKVFQQFPVAMLQLNGDFFYSVNLMVTIHVLFDFVFDSIQ